MRTIAILAGTAGLLLATSSAMADPWFGAPALGGPYVASALGLSAAQKAQMEAIGEACAKEVWPLRSQLFRKTKELEAILERDYDQDDYRISREQYEKRKEVSGVESELREKISRCDGEIRTVLTPEQNESLPDPGEGWAWSLGGPAGRGRVW